MWPTYAGSRTPSRQGRYHNARYKLLGEELGLVIKQHPQIGWSLTELAPGTSEEYADELEELAAALVAYRYAEGQVPALPGDADGADGATGDAGGGDAGAGGGRWPKTAWCWSAVVPSPARSGPQLRWSRAARSCAECAARSSRPPAIEWIVDKADDQ